MLDQSEYQLDIKNWYLTTTFTFFPLKLFEPLTSS